MHKFIFALFFFCLAISGNVFAQDTLPSISVKNRNGKIIISWKNTYGAKINNINIQRSADSVKKFTTIGTVLNPLNKENGYVDAKPPQGKIFYRVFVAFEGGDYVFTRSYRPAIDTTREVELAEKNELFEKDPNEDKTDEKKDAVVKPTPPPAFVPSKFVFTGKDNNVIINLPDAATQKYSIKFYEENGTPLFELHSIKEPYLILEKVNFLHSGWFYYDLLNNGILLEKFKFYIPKDGKIVTNGKEQRNR